MADAPRGNTTRLLLTLAAALVLVGVVIWMLGGFGGAGEEEAETAYEVGVTDESGELIVTDPDAPAIEDVELPETPMTPVPAGEATAEPAAE